MHTRGPVLLVLVSLLLAGCTGVPVGGADGDAPDAAPYGQELRNETALYEQTGAVLQAAGSYTLARSERVTKGGTTVKEVRTLGRRNLTAGRSLVRQEHPGRTQVVFTDTGSGYRHTRVTYPPGETGRNRTDRERYEGNLTEPRDIQPVSGATDAVLETEPLHYDGTATIDGERTYRYVVRNGSWSQVDHSIYTGGTHVERYRLDVFVRPDGSLAQARLTLRLSAAGYPYVAVRQTRYRDLGRTTVTPPSWTEETEVEMFTVRSAAGETR